MLVACLLAFALPAVAQQATPPTAGRHPESGLPLVRNYLPDEYEGGNQNWVIVQDDRGLIYVGSTGATLEYDGTALTPFPTSLDAFWRASQIYRAIALDNGTYVVTTLDGGFALIDRTGEPLQVLDRRSGLATERVYYAMADRDGAIWLAMEGGLARIEVPSPVSFFGEGEGIPVGAQDIVRHQGRLYTVDGRGVRSLRPAASAAEGARFEPIADIRNQTWWLLSIDDPGTARPPELALMVLRRL